MVSADFSIFARTCCEVGQLFFRYVPMRHSKVFPLWDVKLSAVKNYTIRFLWKSADFWYIPHECWDFRGYRAFCGFQLIFGRFTDLLKCWRFLNLTTVLEVFFSKNAYPTKTQSADFWYMGGTCCVPAQGVPSWNFGRDGLISAVLTELVGKCPTLFSVITVFAAR